MQQQRANIRVLAALVGTIATITRADGETQQLQGQSDNELNLEPGDSITITVEADERWAEQQAQQAAQREARTSAGDEASLQQAFATAAPRANLGAPSPPDVIANQGGDPATRHANAGPRQSDADLARDGFGQLGVTGEQTIPGNGAPTQGQTLAAGLEQTQGTDAGVDDAAAAPGQVVTDTGATRTRSTPRTSR